MLRLFCRVLLALVFLGTSAASAQYAKETPKGSTTEDVVRAYGWPKGRSSSGEREIWSYDRFQVWLERGRVVDVRVLELPKTPSKSNVRGQPNSGIVGTAPKGPSPVPTASVTPVAPKRTPAPQVTTSTPRPSPREVQARPSAKAAPASSFSLLGMWAPVIVFFALIAGAAVVVAIRRERRWASEAAPTSSPSNAPKTWEDHIAAKLGPRPVSGHEGVWPGTPAPIPTANLSDLTPALLRSLEWKRFELLVARYYGATGARAECTCIGPDGGIDVKLFRQGEERPYCFIQCKAWDSKKVPVTKLRELRGAMGNEVVEGVFITTSDFWPDALKFAEANGITAINGEQFLANFQALPASDRAKILAEITRGDYTTPSCPSCDSKMVWKPNPKFWACPRYPGCRSKPIYPRAAA